MTKRTSLTRKVRQMRKAITPTAMAKLHELEKLYRQTVLALLTAYNWSETQPNTMIEKSCICVFVCVRELHVRVSVSTNYVEVNIHNFN